MTSNTEKNLNLKDLTRMVVGYLNQNNIKVEQQLVLNVLKGAIEVVKNGYVGDSFAKIVIPGFGSFTNYWTKPKRNSNPFTGNIEMIEAKRKMKFKISPNLVKEAN